MGINLTWFLLDVFEFDLPTVGALAGLPYIATAASVFLSGYLADWLQIKRILTTTQVRKIFNCGSFIGQALFLVACACIMHPVISITCLFLAASVGSFATSGYLVNNLDIAPGYASILFGIMNFFGSLSGFIAPNLAKLVGKEDKKVRTKCGNALKL
jgi:MFS family permease